MLLTVSHSLYPPVVTYTALVKAILLEDVEELSASRSMNLFCIVGLDVTQYPSPLSIPPGGVVACPRAMTDLALCLPGRILDIFFATPSLYMIVGYDDLRMGWKFPWSGCLFPQKNHLTSSDSILARSWKSLCNREK